MGNERLGRTGALRDALGNAAQSASARLAGALAVGLGVPAVFGVFGLVGAAPSVAVVARARARQSIA